MSDSGRPEIPMRPLSLTGVSITGPAGPWLPAGSIVDRPERIRPAAPPGDVDEFDEFLSDQMQDPGFRAAYGAAEKRIRRAWLGYGGLPVDGREYQRRLRARRRRRR